ALAYSVEYPVVFYSWPSVPKTLKYVVDGGNNEWSQEHFNMFLNDLLQFRNEHKIHLIIVSHSMGNRLVMRAAHLLERTQLVRDAEL
ncbi:alpha/beta hydrolase, partial [Acinetobacter baumannii]